MSFPILELFKENYEKTNNPDDFVKVKDVIETIKLSDTYNLYNKAEKRIYNYKYILEFIQTNQQLSRSYKEVTRINGVQMKSVLVGYKSNIIVEDVVEDVVDF
jgi:hypothetical protein